jgi:hypothetical protein
MDLFLYARTRNWPVMAGYLLFIGMMAIGYFYNVTFIQLGLKDLGERRLGLPATSVAQQMALLALVTCLVALAIGWWMQHRGWGTGVSDRQPHLYQHLDRDTWRQSPTTGAVWTGPFSPRSSDSKSPGSH